MKAVVLVGGVSTWLYPLAHRRPRALLLIANEPALLHVLRHLARHGVTDAYIPLGPNLKAIREEVGEFPFPDFRVHYADELKYCGAAAGVGLFRSELKDAPFLVVNGNSLSRLDLAPLLSSSEREPSWNGKPFLHAGVYSGLAGMSSFGARRTLPVDREGGAPVFWESHPQALAHVYLMHPRLLDFIPAGRYYDIREQLLSRALAEGVEVRGVQLEGTVNEFRTLHDFLRANHEAIREKAGEGSIIAPSAQVSPSAVISGPVIVGEDARIGPESTVVGPTVIGRGAVVGRGAVLIQSAVGPGARVGHYSHLHRSLLFRHARVGPKRRLTRTVILGDEALPNGYEHFLDHNPDNGGWDVLTDRFKDRFRVQDRLSYRVFKRLLDLTAVFLTAPVTVPLCFLLGAVVRFMSPGPVIFREKRMTRGGRPFTMIKFRTMYVNAHLDQSSLRDKNQTDGPMFKIVNDPRITPLGHWLRRTSLDELPQLWNVLKGEMSLVGPRPLAEREMKWHPVWRVLRLGVKPGMTGLWQVMCGSYSDFADWISYDVRYVQDACLSLDLKILIKTIGVVIYGRRPAGE
jgi:lipopolysaccharide/colanic/teichoic acid biosynthesis glycosyltransferase/NDP-sugar pyrophosphorylase family protein